MRGYRVWVPRGETLGSYGGYGDWEPGENEAGCIYNKDIRQGPHPVPVADCTCGFWAFDSIDALAAETGCLRMPDTKVYGEVELWGKVQRHERGYRAQFAKIVAIWEPDSPEFNFNETDALERALRFALAYCGGRLVRNPLADQFRTKRAESKHYREARAKKSLKTKAAIRPPMNLADWISFSQLTFVRADFPLPLMPAAVLKSAGDGKITSTTDEGGDSQQGPVPTAQPGE